MIRVSPRLFLVSAFALSIFAAAPALSEPGAAPPGASPDACAASSRDAASGLPTGKRMHKPYSVAATGPVEVASDPEEGGQVARTATKPKVSEITVVKTTDSASTKLAEAAPSGSASCGSGQH